MGCSNGETVVVDMVARVMTVEDMAVVAMVVVSKMLDVVVMMVRQWRMLWQWWTLNISLLAHQSSSTIVS